MPWGRKCSCDALIRDKSLQGQVSKSFSQNSLIRFAHKWLSADLCDSLGEKCWEHFARLFEIFPKNQKSGQLL